MAFLHPSIFYIHFKTFGKLIWLNCFKHFGWRRFLATGLFLFLYSLIVILMLVFRLLDEIIFFGYRKQQLKNPVFIISNPRSGTTYLHRLLSQDGDRYAYTLLYHTIFPSITVSKLIDGIGWLDRKIGRPIRKFFDWLDRILFAGWQDIHPMGFNSPEEDEGMFVLNGLTPAMFLFSPYIKELEYLKFSDDLPPKTRKKLIAYYKNCLQRFMYARGKNKILLDKNVLSTGRLKLILEMFPDARIVYLVRHPYKSVPSLISMFRKPWNVHSPEFKDDSPRVKEWGYLAMDYYNYMNANKAQFHKKNFITVRYEDLIDEPKNTVLKIYEHFGMEPTPEFLEALSHLTRRNKNYKSKHSYTIEEYGFTKNEIYERLQEVFQEYGFER